MTTRKPLHLLLSVDRLPPLNTSDRRRHWSVQHKEAEAWKWLVFGELGGDIPKRPWRKVKMICTRHSSRQPDYDNLVASFKPVIDALVKNSVIADDRPDNFEGEHPDYEWVKGQSHITVEIYDASGDAGVHQAVEG